jgi:hypothetical protein
MTGSRPLVCLFSVPKPFTGLAAIHQTNAISSWRRLRDDVEVMLCGDESGAAEIARSYAVRHIPEILRNEYGTPLISSAFEAATEHTRARLLCYINADIILMSDFLRALDSVHLPSFVLCGRRWNLELPYLLDFEAEDWELKLRTEVDRSGELHAPTAMDYFAFPRGLIRHMPPFAIGRTVWDNWLLFHARALGAPLIDATQSITIVHQNHTYAHIDGGVQAAWSGPEARRNRALGSDMLFPFSIEDATYELEHSGLKRKPAVRAPVRRLESHIALTLRNRPTTRRLLRRLLRAKEV